MGWFMTFFTHITGGGDLGQVVRPQVAKMVGPKKEALAIAEGQLKEAEDKLAVKKATNSETFRNTMDIPGP